MKTIISHVVESAASLINDTDSDIIHDDFLELIDEETDNLFQYLVQGGRIDEYTVQDMVSTAVVCGEIIELAEEFAWVEDDPGLWAGLTYGILACIAYYSLRNCIVKAIENHNIDLEADYPLWLRSWKWDFDKGGWVQK